MSLNNSAKLNTSCLNCGCEVDNNSIEEDQNYYTCSDCGTKYKINRVQFLWTVVNMLVPVSKPPERLNLPFL